MRVSTFLAENRVDCEMLFHPPAYTSQKRARFLHVPGRQVAKCVLLKGVKNYLLAVLPATYRLDTTLLTVTLGEPVRLARNEEIAEIFPDCEWGAIPPFGNLYGLSTLLEDTIDRETYLVFEGQTHGVSYRMRCRDFEHYERPRRLAFARPHFKQTMNEKR